MAIVITITEPLALGGATSLTMAVNAPTTDVPVFRSGGIFSVVGFSRTSVTGPDMASTSISSVGFSRTLVTEPVMASTSTSSVGLVRTSVTTIGLEN